MAISANDFIEAGRQHGYSLYTGVPCSYLKPFINYVIDSSGLSYVGAANEGDAVAIASGAEIGGRHSVVMFQNSGFGNTVNPLTSLNAIFKIPTLVITTWRGEPGGAHDEPQHDLMGQITPGLFDLMRIPWELFPTEQDKVAGVWQRAVDHMTKTRTPYGLIMQKDAVNAYKLQSKPTQRDMGLAQPIEGVSAWAPADSLPSRSDLLKAVQQAVRPSDVIVATTGYTGRELYALADLPNQLYMVGSMGCASTFGLGLALAQPNRRVIVLDGDGAILMRMGALATLGYERPNNLIHIALDNEVHESTGGQSTVTHSIDFATCARGCGYPKVARVQDANSLAQIVSSGTDQLTFVHAKMKQGVPKDLPRPTVTPIQVVDRLKAFMGVP